MVMGHLGLTAFYPSLAPPHPPPSSAFVMPYGCLFLGKPPRQRDASVTLSRGLQASSSKPGADYGEKKQQQQQQQQQQEHSEQKAGFKPPLPLEDDGFQVDMTELQDLVESGEASALKRVHGLRKRGDVAAVSNPVLCCSPVGLRNSRGGCCVVLVQKRVLLCQRLCREAMVRSPHRGARTCRLRTALHVAS